MHMLMHVQVCGVSRMFDGTGLIISWVPCCFLDLS